MWYLDILKSSMSIMRKIDCRKENHETSRDEKYMKKYNVRMQLSLTGTRRFNTEEKNDQ